MEHGLTNLRLYRIISFRPNEFVISVLHCSLCISLNRAGFISVGPRNFVIEFLDSHQFTDVTVDFTGGWRLIRADGAVTKFLHTFLHHLNTHVEFYVSHRA